MPSVSLAQSFFTESNSVKLGNSSSATHSNTESYDDRSESPDLDSAGKKESEAEGLEAWRERMN